MAHMVGELMVGHEQHPDIPPGKQFPLWQATSAGRGGVQQGWRPVMHKHVYYSPDGRLADKKGIFCTAVKRGESFTKGQKWATHDEMETHFKVRQAGLDAAPHRNAAKERRAAKEAAKNEEQRRTGLIPLPKARKRSPIPDWEARIDQGCSPEPMTKRHRPTPQQWRRPTFLNDDDHSPDAEDPDGSAMYAEHGMMVPDHFNE